MTNNETHDKGEIRDEVLSGWAWARFCDALKAAGELVQQRATCDLDRVEGYRYLSRVARGGIHSFVEAGDRRFPLLATLPDQVKIGSDNPDSLYLSGNIDGRLNYRISGHRGTVHYLSITAFTGNYGAGQDRLGQAGFLHGSDLIVDDDGRFEIFVGPERRGDNWLQTSPEPTVIAVRQFFLDRASEVPVSVLIKCLDHDDLPPPLSAARFGRALESAAAFVAGCSALFTDWVDDLGSSHRGLGAARTSPDSQGGFFLYMTGFSTENRTRSVQKLEGGPHLGHEALGLLEGGEMAAHLGLVPVPDVGVALLSPAPTGPEDLVGEDAAG